jgi:hypothetical protein
MVGNFPITISTQSDKKSEHQINSCQFVNKPDHNNQFAGQQCESISDCLKLINNNTDKINELAFEPQKDLNDNPHTNVDTDMDEDSRDDLINTDSKAKTTLRNPRLS